MAANYVPEWAQDDLDAEAVRVDSALDAAADAEAVYDDFDYALEYEDYGYEDYEPSPYDGTYSEM